MLNRIEPAVEKTLVRGGARLKSGRTNAIVRVVSCLALQRQVIRGSSPRRLRHPQCQPIPRQHHGDTLPRLSPAHALCSAFATAYRACLPRLAGRAQRHHGRCPGFLIGAKTGHFLRYAMSGDLDLGVFRLVIHPPCAIIVAIACGLAPQSGRRTARGEQDLTSIAISMRGTKMTLPRSSR
jgi:hypothetical protein